MDAAPHHSRHAATTDPETPIWTPARTGSHAPGRDAPPSATCDPMPGRMPSAPLPLAIPAMPTLSLDGLWSHGRGTSERVCSAMQERFPDGIACVPDTDGSVIAHCRLGSHERETVLRIQASLRADFASARVERTVRARSASGHRVTVRLHGLAPGATCHVRFLVLGALGWEASPIAMAMGRAPALCADGEDILPAVPTQPAGNTA